MGSVITGDGLSPGQIYRLDYFSGAQLGIWIGDIFIDEIVSLRYEVRQRKTPIYGYASQLFDTVAPGPVIVEGGFNINFKEAGYLWLVLTRYKALEILANQAVGVVDLPPGTREMAALGVPDLADALANINPEASAIIERLVTGQASQQERTEFYSSISDLASSINPSHKAEFQGLVDRFEERVWGNKDLKNDTADLQSRRVDSNVFDNVDIFLTFGDVGSIGDGTIKAGPASTVRRIRGVHFTGQGQEVIISGEPVMEYYSFIARTVI